MLDINKYFQLKLLLLLLFLALLVNAQQMQLSIKSPSTAGELVKVRVEASGLDGMYAACCTLFVDHTVLHSSEATIAAGLSNISVTARFRKTVDTVIIRSVLIDSSHTLSQETLVVLNFPPLTSLSNYAAVISIIGGSIELKTGRIVQVNINSTAIRYAYNQRIRFHQNNSTTTAMTVTGLFDIRGRSLGNSAKMFQFSGKRSLVNQTRQPDLSYQVIIGKN